MFKKFKKFRNKPFYPYFDEPEPIVKAKPPTARNAKVEETNPYLAQPIESDIYTQQAQSLAEKIPGVEAILMEYLEKETEDKRETGDWDDISEAVENLPESKGIKVTTYPNGLTVWDLEYEEYIKGVRITNNISGVWVIDETRVFQLIASKPSFISFGEENVINGFNGFDIDDVSIIEGRFAENIEAVEKVVADNGGINLILSVRFS